MAQPPITLHEQRWGQGFHRLDGPSMVYVATTQDPTTRDSVNVMSMSWFVTYTHPNEVAKTQLLLAVYGHDINIENGR